MELLLNVFYTGLMLLISLLICFWAINKRGWSGFAWRGSAFCLLYGFLIYRFGAFTPDEHACTVYNTAALDWAISHLIGFLVVIYFFFWVFLLIIDIMHSVQLWRILFTFFMVEIALLILHRLYYVLYDYWDIFEKIHYTCLLVDLIRLEKFIFFLLIFCLLGWWLWVSSNLQAYLRWWGMVPQNLPKRPGIISAL